LISFSYYTKVNSISFQNKSKKNICTVIGENAPNNHIEQYSYWDMQMGFTPFV